MEISDIPDWLQSDKPEMTTEDIQNAWQNFAKLHLEGKIIELECRGGDGYEITAVIEKVIPILGVGVALKISGATIICQREEEQIPQDLPEARYVFLDHFGYPPKFQESIIILTSGGVCLDQEWEVEFGGCLSIGFIYIS
jgi:hypothetical protein